MGCGLNEKSTSKKREMPKHSLPADMLRMRNGFVHELYHTFLTRPMLSETCRCPYPITVASTFTGKVSPAIDPVSQKFQIRGFHPVCRQPRQAVVSAEYGDGDKCIDFGDESRALCFSVR